MESSESEPSAENHDISNGHLAEEVSGAESSPSLIPPYWSHRRYESYSSVKNTRPPPITLEDHTEEPSEQSGALWAKSITIDDHVLLSGTLPNVGSFVVWNCKIETLDTEISRYSEFDDLRRKLLMTFPKSGGAMPPLPPKSLFYKFRPSFLEKRRTGLAYFLNCVLLNPDLSSAPVTKEFIFS
ncbi:MAG: PX domain-containing protein ypt35 [Alectoria sarmentosa]|nr:MAG: PX domain-containing protein ypt35 [Alectoria sarmentosa]